MTIVRTGANHIVGDGIFALFAQTNMCYTTFGANESTAGRHEGPYNVDIARARRLDDKGRLAVDDMALRIGVERWHLFRRSRNIYTMF